MWRVVRSFCHTCCLEVLKISTPWKRLVTLLQITQFLFMIPCGVAVVVKARDRGCFWPSVHWTLRCFCVYLENRMCVCHVAFLLTIQRILYSLHTIINNRWGMCISQVQFPKRVAKSVPPDFPTVSSRVFPQAFCPSNVPWLQIVLTASFPRVSVKHVLTGSFPRASLKIVHKVFRKCFDAVSLESVLTLTLSTSPCNVGFACPIRLIFSTRHQAFGNMMNMGTLIFFVCSRDFIKST